MMLDADKMVAAASSRNPTLAGALTRLQRCAFSGSWEVESILILPLEFSISSDKHQILQCRRCSLINLVDRSPAPTLSECPTKMGYGMGMYFYKPRGETCSELNVISPKL